MISLASVLIIIAVLFLLFLLLRAVFSLKVCAICAAVSGSWIVLLLLFYFGFGVDAVLIAILLGGSIVGLMYLLEGTLAKQYGIFRLPYFLSALVIAYMLLGGAIEIAAVFALATIWLLAIIVFWGRKKKGFKDLVKKIIECCREW
ncbi:MAG: hypothetical protein Q8Q32_01125 [bacterium]|nr:hypothetical protein [bacterium]